MNGPVQQNFYERHLENKKVVDTVLKYSFYNNNPELKCYLTIHASSGKVISSGPDGEENDPTKIPEDFQRELLEKDGQILWVSSSENSGKLKLYKNNLQAARSVKYQNTCISFTDMGDGFFFL